MLSFVAKTVSSKGRIVPHPTKLKKPGRMTNASQARSYSKKYSQTNEWIDVDGSVVELGITANAAAIYREVYQVDILQTKVGSHLKAGSIFAGLFCEKLYWEVYAPMSGEVIEINKGLNKPDGIDRAQDCVDWIVKIKLSDPTEFNSLLDQDAYKKYATKAGYWEL